MKEPEDGMSDRQLYKQAGNGVTVVEAIRRNLALADAELKQEDLGYVT